MSIAKTIIKRGRRASPEQKGALLSYLEDNINFAHERFESDAGANTHQLKWHELSVKLNAMGGAFKSAEQWKQYWRDLKRNVKAKAAEEKRQIEASGINGMRPIKSLDDVERRTISIMAIDVTDGDAASQERGFPNMKTVSYQEVMDFNTIIIADQEGTDLNTAITHHPQSHSNETTIADSPIREKNTAEKRRKTVRSSRAQQNANEMSQYLEQQKLKISLKREQFEFNKKIKTETLELEKIKAAAFVSMGESLKCLRFQLEPNNSI